jgi:hypothetical protein
LIVNKHKETIKSGTGLLVRNYGGLFIRALRRERIWRAHREHYYQRLILSGWSHRKTAIWEYALMLACAVLALAAREAVAPMQAATVAVAIAACAVCAVWIDRRCPHSQG